MIELKLIMLRGFSVLIVAILLNIIASKLNITTWFVFVEQISKYGLIQAIQRQNIFALLFLFIIYPFCLGYSFTIAEGIIK